MTRAQDALARQAQDPDDPDACYVRGRILLTRAYARSLHGDAAAADDLLEQAGALADIGPHAGLQILVAVQRSAVHGRAGRWREVIDVLDAVDPQDPQATPRACCLVHLNRGLAQQLLGQYVQARQSLDAAVVAASSPDLADLRAAALHNRGRLSWLVGDLPTALRLMSQAREADPEFSQAVLLLDHVRVLADAGLVDEAQTLLNQASDDARRHRLAHESGECALEAARLAIVRGEYAQARAHAHRARTAFARIGAETWVTHAAVLGMEADVAAGQRVRQVARHSSAMLAQAARLGAMRAETALVAAEANAVLGGLDVARQQLRSVSRLQLPFVTRLHVDLVRATIADREDDPRVARRHLATAARRLSFEQARHAGIDSRTALALHTRRLAALDVTLALRAGAPAQVHLATERWRAASHRLPAVTAPADDELTQLLTSLREARSHAGTARTPAERRAQTARMRDIERRIARRDWELSDHRGDVGPAGLPGARVLPYAALSRQLQARGTGLASFFVAEGRLRALRVDDSGGAVLDLAPQGEVESLVSRLLSELVTVGRVVGLPVHDTLVRALRHTCARLDALLAPAIPAQERILVLPSRLLAAIPWRLLPSVANRPLVCAMSATSWAAQPTPRAGALTVGVVSGPGLDRAAPEARSVADIWHAPSPQSRGLDLANALRDNTIVHIAAHGTHHDESPLFSSVLLQDGPVFAHDFQRVGVGAHHVVLSSCDVGRTTMRLGDEPLGLTAALLATGVRSVVAATAPVHDEQAEALMAAYHRGLAQGLDAAAALAHASEGLEDAALFCTYGADWGVTSA